MTKAKTFQSFVDLVDFNFEKIKDFGVRNQDSNVENESIMISNMITGLKEEGSLNQREINYLEDLEYEDFEKYEYLYEKLQKVDYEDFLYDYFHDNF